mgnify:CR=1 FL=1
MQDFQNLFFHLANHKISDVFSGFAFVHPGFGFCGVASFFKLLAVAYRLDFALTESVAVINKKKYNPTAMEMAECIIKNARADIIKDYPVALYKDETVDAENQAANSKVFPETLTTELLKKHQELSESCK